MATFGPHACFLLVQDTPVSKAHNSGWHSEKVGYTVDGSPVHHRVNICRDESEWMKWCACFCSVGGNWKEKIKTCTGRSSKLHPAVWIKPRTFLLCGAGYNWATPYVCWNFDIAKLCHKLVHANETLNWDQAQRHSPLHEVKMKSNLFIQWNSHKWMGTIQITLVLSGGGWAGSKTALFTSPGVCLF